MNVLRVIVNGLHKDGASVPYTCKPLALFMETAKKYMTEGTSDNVPIGKKVLVGITGEIIGLAIAVFMFLETVFVTLFVGLILLGLFVQAKIRNKMDDFAQESKNLGEQLGQRVLIFLHTSFLGGFSAVDAYNHP